MKLPWNSHSGFKLDLAANLTASAWSMLIQLVCVPLYIRFLGVEAYGLIGFYLMLQAMLQVLDLGLSPTMNREMARYSVQPEKADEARDLVRTLEVGYWLIGMVIGAAILMAAPWLAVHWIKAGAIPVRSVVQTVMLMGALAFFQWPFSFYQGGLVGLRHQVLVNVMKVGAATLVGLGGVLIIWRVSTTIHALLIWQICVNAVCVATLRICLWSSLPSSERRARFDLVVAQNVRGFAAGMTGIAVTSLVLTQADKLLASKLFSLRTFGYYALAWSLANSPLVVAGCLFNVSFPRMSALVSAGDEEAMSQLYHRGSQLMAVLILPVAAIVSLFSFEILHLWIGNSETASGAAPILSVLFAGSAINALLYLPFVLQLAAGWTKLPLVAGVVSIMILVPLMFPMAKYFGPVGAASIWTMLNVLNMLIAVPIMHRRLLRGETWNYFEDIGLPLLGVVSTVTLGRLMFTKFDSRLATIAVLSGLWLVSQLVAVLAAPLVRTSLVHHFSKRSVSYV